MRARLTLLLTLLVSLLVAVPTVGASPADRWSGPYFGDGNLPPGCVTDMNDSDCYHMRTALNALDSPKIDVLVLVPVSPFVERDARIEVQAVEMWRDGIDYLAREMGLNWLADTVEFRIAVNHVDLVSGEGTENFSTYPLWDPEIVVVSSNPVGGIGIGVDPLDFSSQLLEIFGIEGTGEGPCHGIQNPFDFAQWQALAGFDDHHGQGTGTYYEEDCDGAGGNVCFAVNGAIDPDPGNDTGAGLDIFGLFNLVAHEIGHCLTVGHVGDALDHTSKTVPTWDIMSYTDHPEGQTKCVSTLNVEVFATWMSQYIDTTGDGAIGDDNILLVNDQQGDGSSPFHVQHPRDHFYASSTGDPWDCPQPDLGVNPTSDRTDWTPEPARAERVLTITSPADGDTTSGAVTVTGTAERHYDSDTSWNPHTSDGDASASTTSAGTASAVTRSLTGVDTRSWTGTLYPEQSTLGMMATGATFSLDVSGPATVEFALTWTDDLAPNDLDLFITGAASGSGTTGTPGEYVLLENVDGTLNMRVEPWLVLDPLGTNFTLTATITGGSQGGGGGGGDLDNSGIPATEAVLVYDADGTLIGSQDVWTRERADSFAITTSTLEAGTHTLRIDWEDRGSVIASESVTVTVGDSGSGGGDNGEEKHPSCRPHPRKGTTPPGQESRCA